MDSRRLTPEEFMTTLNFGHLSRSDNYYHFQKAKGIKNLEDTQNVKRNQNVKHPV